MITMGRHLDDGHPVHLQDETGIPYGIKHVANKIRTSSVPYTYDIAKGNVSSHDHIRKFGHNDDVGATNETLWSAGGLYPWPTAAEILKVSSSDTDDDGDPAGDGARTIQLYGLDANYALQDETIILNGQGSVSTVGTYIRAYRATVLTAGASKWNEGTISVKNNADAVTLLTVEPLHNQSLVAAFTIPAGCTGYVVSWYGATSSNKVTEVEMYIRPFGQVFQIRTLVELNQQPFREEWIFPEAIPEKSDIEMRAAATGGGGAVSGGFTLWYEEN